jgi:hypothetical protein
MVDSVCPEPNTSFFIRPTENISAMVKMANLFVVFLFIVLACSGCLGGPTVDKAKVAEPGSTAKSELGVEVTIYNSDLGVVKDTRKIGLKDGVSPYSFEGVASGIDPTSVKLTSQDGSFNILEQNYQYDLVGKEKLLEKYLGKRITGFKVLGQAKEPVEGTLLSSSGDELTLKASDGSLEIVSVNDVLLPSLPEGLIIKPTLNWLIYNEKAGEKTAELSYMTSGMGWEADYVLVTDKDDSKADVNGWVTITNNAGTTFQDAALKLVAGDVNRVTTTTMPHMVLDNVKGGKDEEGQFAQETIFEYHLYDLQRRTTIRDREQKQISLLTANGVSVDKEYVYEGQGGWYNYGSDSTKVQVKLNFNNSKGNRLGIPLPKGRVRVFKADSEGKLQFLGEDQIDHTPKDETLRILVGNAFDVVGQRKQMKVNQLGTCQYEVTWQDTLRNHKSEDVKVTVLEDTGWDWTITAENYQHTKESNKKIRWTIPVKADRESTLTYTIRYKLC